MAPPDALPDGPDADLQEQRTEVDPSSTGTVPGSRVTQDAEVPEADALEQAQDVPLSDEEHG